MKAFLKLFLLVILTSILFLACDNDPEGPPPIGEGIVEEITAIPGDEIAFKGTFTTESTFKMISLENDALQLDKEIIFANETSKYYLDYKFTISEEVPFAIYDVKISAESTDGAMEEFNVKVEVTSIPQIDNLTNNISALAGEVIHILGSFSDAQGLTSIVIENAGVGLDTSIAVQDNPTSFALDFMHTIPLNAEQIVHKGSATVTNIAGRSVTGNLDINLTGQSLTYTEMYLAGGVQWWTWDAEHAYMMKPSTSDEKWFETIIPAWPEDGYSEVKFLGQLAWTPDNWGLIDNTNASLGMVNAEDSQPIILDAAGSSYYPAYFKVGFNPYDVQFTAEEIDQSGFTPQNEMYVVGIGFPEYPNLDWNPSEAIPMVQNPDGYGEHIFAIYSLEFSEDVALKFIGQKDGWGPIDIGFDTDYIVDLDEDTDGYQVMSPVSWMPTKSGSGTADLKFVGQPGVYTVLYDHFAKSAIVWQE